MRLPSEPVPVAAYQLTPGTLIAERYRVEAMLGEGGMGIVFRAEHVHMRKRVAIKVLLPAWTSTPEVVARFEREAVAAGAISHPNVASATDFGRLADGSFFLVLEYVEGRTLRAELAPGALDLRRALTIARSIALGIGAAHAKGIVHRDLKPENVMLVARDGDPDFVKVLDFGIARVEHRSVEGGALTSAGAILGTPDYMAPEQALGRDIDSRADLYALGVMLFEMLTGACPFRGGAVTLLQQHLLTPAPPLPPHVAERVPAGVRTLVARLLEKEASARYASAAEVIAVLDGCIAAMASNPARVVVAAGPASAGRPAIGDSVERCAEWLRAHATEAAVLTLAALRRRPRAALVVAGAGVALIVGTALAWSAGKTSRHPAAAAPAQVVSPAPSPSSPSRAPTAPPPKSSALTCLEGAFADHIEHGRPAGDAAAIAAAQQAIYWVDIANPNRATQVTLIWTIDGVEVQRQSLRIGHGNHWRTWGSRAIHGGHTISVQVLDPAGESLKEDSIRLDG